MDQHITTQACTPVPTPIELDTDSKQDTQATPVEHLGVALSAFSGEGALGNSCKVVALEEPINQAQLDAYIKSAQQLPDSCVLCLTWPELGDRQFSAICLQNTGRTIDCCGHGLLSVAGCWLSALNETAVYLTAAAHGEHQSNQSIRALQGEQAIWLEFTPLPYQSISEPDWLSGLLNDSITPLACRHFGDDSDYLLIQWPDGSDLAQCKHPTQLAKFTQRALIVTCVLEPGVIAMRYFAPQYGVMEDTATGSALRCAAQFYADQMGWRHLECHQKSERGGYLLAQMSDEVIRVGGFLTAESRTNHTDDKQ